MRGRILIVDDQPDFFEQLSIELKERDYKVDIAASIKEAEKTLNNPDITYDLLLVDLLFDGTEEKSLLFIDRLRDKGVSTKIIIVTHSNSVPTVIKVLRNTKIDVEDFLLKKEYDIFEWLNRIKHEINGSSKVQNNGKNIAVWQISRSAGNVEQEDKEQQKRRARELIAQNDIQKCISFLLGLTTIQSDPGLNKEMISLSRRWVEYNTGNNMNTIEANQKEIIKNQIIDGLLDVIQKI